MSARVTVVVPTHETRELTLRCLAAVTVAESPAIVVVDDGSTDGTSDAVARRFPEARVLRHGNAQGFTAAANAGLAAARGDLLLLLNSDTEVAPDALPRLVAAFDAAPRLGAAGAALVGVDGRPQWSGGAMPTTTWLAVLASGVAPQAARLPGYRRARPLHPAGAARVDWVPGAALAMRREVWEAVGSFDERFRLYAQDLDWCVRVRDAGWTIAILADVRIVHIGGATVGRLAGAVGSAHPELLWTDLVRWAAKRGGAAAGRRALRALTAGAALRVAARVAATPLVPAAARAAWRKDTDAYRRARAALAASAAMLVS